MLNISINAEPVFEIFGFTVTNSFLTSVVVLVLLFVIAQYYRSQLQKKNKSGLFYFMQLLVNEIYKLFKGVLGEKIDVLFPVVGAFFFYILLQNWFGLLPGIGSLLVKVEEHGEIVKVPLFRGAAADLNTTLALALVAVVAIQFYSIKYLGLGGYFKRFFASANPINIFLGVLEVISELSRILSFAFRLFGNVFAGEVLLLVIAFLIPVFVSFPFFIMEIFVGFVQALVFAMLTGVFLSMATVKHHH
jgi:F-type H+-transporting ATPase subunit a